MDPVDWFDVIVAKAGITPSDGLIFIVMIMFICNIAGRLIPDSAIGWLGTTRKICKIIGIFIQNRVLPGVTVGDLAMTAHSVASQASAVADLVADEQGIPEAELAGRRALTPNGFVDCRLLMVLLLLLSLILLLTTACQSPGQSALHTGQLVCQDRVKAQILLDSVASNRTSAEAQKVFDLLAITCPILLPHSGSN